GTGAARAAAALERALGVGVLALLLEHAPAQEVEVRLLPRRRGAGRARGVQRRVERLRGPGRIALGDVELEQAGAGLDQVAALREVLQQLLERRDRLRVVAGALLRLAEHV